MSDVYRIPCPSCSHRLKVKSDYIGKKASCKHCGKVFTLQLPETPEAEDAPDEPLSVEQELANLRKAVERFQRQNTRLLADAEEKRREVARLREENESLRAENSGSMLTQWEGAPPPQFNTPATTATRDETEFQRILAEAASAREELVRLRDELSAVQSTYVVERDALLRTTEGQAAAHVVELHSMREEVDRVRAELELSREQLALRQNQMEEGVGRLAELQSTLDSTQSELARLRDELSRTKHSLSESQASRTRDEEDWKSQLNTLETELRAQKEATSEASSRYEASLAELRAELETAKSEVSQSRSDAEGLNREIETYKDAENARRGELDRLRQEVDRLKLSLEEQTRAADELHSTLRAERATHSARVGSLEADLRSALDAEKKAREAEVQSLQEEAHSWREREQARAEELAKLSSVNWEDRTRLAEEHAAAAAAELESARNEIERLLNERNQGQVRWEEERATLDRLSQERDAELATLRNELAQTRQDLQQTNTTLREERKERERLADRATQVIADLEAARCEIKRHQESVLSAELALREQQDSQTKTQHEALEQARAELASARDESEELRRQLSDLRETSASDIQRLRDEFNDSIAEAKSREDRWNSEQGAAIEEVKALREQSDRLAATHDLELSRLREELADAQTQVEAIRSEAGALRIQLFEREARSEVQPAPSHALLAHATAAPLDNAEEFQKELEELRTALEAERKARATEVNSLRIVLTRYREDFERERRTWEEERRTSVQAPIMPSSPPEAVDGQLKASAEIAEDLARQLEIAASQRLQVESDLLEAHKKIEALQREMMAARELRDQMRSSLSSLGIKLPT